MKDRKNKGKGILKRTAAMALAVMTFATSFSCDYAAVGAWAKDVASATVASGSAIGFMNARVGAKKAKKRNGPMKAASIEPPISFKDNFQVEARMSNGNPTLKDDAIGDGQQTHGWSVKFTDEYANLVQGTEGNRNVYRVTYFNYGNNEPVNKERVSVNITYTAKNKNGETREFTVGNGLWSLRGNGTIGSGNESAELIVKTDYNFQNKVLQFSGDDVDNSYLGGITVMYATQNSITINPSYEFDLRETEGGDEKAVSWNDDIGIAESFEYDGTNIQPQVWLTTITNNGNSKSERQITDVSYASTTSTNVQNHSYTLTARLPKDLNFETVTINYSIDPRSIKNHYASDPTSTTGITIGNIDDQTYTGVGVKPSLTVTDKDVPTDKQNLTSNDYTASYSNNINANADKDGNAIADKPTPSVKITGKGNYTDSAEKNFNIRQKEITDSTTDVDIQVPDGAYDGGDEVKPVPEIKYTPVGVTDAKGKNVENTLKEGTDFDVTYANNREKTTDTMAEADKPTATIVFKGNYTGTVTKTFKINNGILNANNTQVYLGSDKLITTIKNSDNKQTTTKITKDDSGDAITDTFDPIADEYPDFRLRINGRWLTKGVDYTAEKPVATNGTHTWPSVNDSGWHWKATIKAASGSSYVSTNSIEITFDVKQLSLTDDAISTRRADFNGNNHATVVILQYTSKQDDTKTTNIVSSKNFTVSPKSYSGAGTNIPITVTAIQNRRGEYTGNYKNSITVHANSGYDLSTATTDRDAEVRLTYYDPFTGENLTEGNNKSMPYYGSGIAPKVIVEIRGAKDSKGNYTYRPTSDYTVSTPVQTDNSQIMKVTIASKPGGELYGTVSDDLLNGRYNDRYTISKQSFANRMYAAGKEPEANDTNDIYFTYDTGDLTSFDTESAVGQGLKVWMQTKDAKTSKTITAAGHESDTDEQTKAYYQWNRPVVSELLTYGTDYTLTKKSGATYTINGASNSNYYAGSADITLYANISNNDDYYISPEKIDDITWDGKAHFPEIELRKKETTGGYSTIPASDYEVSYYSQSGNVTVTGGATSTYTATTGQEPFAAAGSYSVTITMKDTNSSNVSGSKTIPYRIVRLSTETNLSAYFGGDKDVPPTVNYLDKDNDGKTPLPQFYNGDKEGSTKLRLHVFMIDPDTGKETGTDLTRDNVWNSYYDVEPNKTENPEYYNEPGVKRVRIIGKGKYQGVVEATYTVKGNLGEIDNKAKYEVDGIPFLTETDPHNQTLYSDGNGGFVDVKGRAFSLDNINITTKGGTPLKKGNGDGRDYVIETNTDNKITTSTKQIVIRGKAGSAYEGTSYTINVNVIESRAGLLWSKGQTQSLDLDYRAGGYTLQQGDLALYSRTSENYAVTLTEANADKTTGDTVSVTCSGGTAKVKSGNDTVYPVFEEPGDYTITITGPKPLELSSTLFLHIRYNLDKLTDNDVTIRFENPHVYDGNNKYDASYVTVNIDGKTLTSGSDYTINSVKGDDIKKDGDAGTYSIVINSIEGFSKGSYTTTYTITPLAEDDKYGLADSNKPIATFEYDGEAHQPDDSVYTKGLVTYDGTPLVYGQDYTVSYESDLTNAGNKSIIVHGIGNYAGAKTIPNAFVINKCDLSKKTITIPDQLYTGHEIEPKTIKVSGVTGDLIKDEQYTVSNGKNNVNPAATKAASVDITGYGVNFTGTAKDVAFRIKKLDLSDTSEYTPDITDATYNRGAEIPLDNYIRITIPDGDTQITLTRGRDYSITLTEDGKNVKMPVTDAGNYKVTFTALSTSPYLTAGSMSQPYDFRVKPLSIEDNADQFHVEDADWNNGNAVTPVVRLNNDVISRDGRDLDPTYKVTFTNNTDACGKTREEMLPYDPNFDEKTLPTATIVGTGNYTGTISLHFRIGQPFSSATITATSTNILRYTGAAQRREYTVSYKTSSGRMATLDSSRYRATYPDNVTDAGSKTVLFVANGGPLYGTATKTYTIYPAAGTTWGIEFTDLSMDSSGQYVVQYQGAAITPEVRVYVLGSNGTRTDMDTANYKITYANNNAAGTASVTVDPQNYEGTKTLYFRILGVDISNNSDIYAAFTDGLTRRKYTGSAITPAVTITFAGNLGAATLTKDRDYSLTYENNTNAGAANVKITGIGNYSGTIDLPFAIWADLNDKTSTFTIPKQMYTGEPITALEGATIKAGGNDLVLGTDYTLAITSSDAYRTKGTAIFTAQGQYYEGTRTVQFDIGNDASMYNVIGVASTYVFDHQAHKPVPVVTDKQGQVYATDSVTYQSTSDGDACINAGNVRMTIAITSHGQTVSIPYNYMIEPRNINTATFTPLRDVNYNGKAHTPSVRITEGTRLLTSSKSINDGSADYVVTYYNNVAPGKAHVVVTGINNYTGTSNLYFDINVKAAPQMIVTAMPSGRLKVTWNKVSGVSGYRVFYTPTNGTQKQVNVSKSRKSTYLTGLTRGVVYTVGVQSYITANGVNGYSSASVQQIATSTKKPTITSAKSTGKGRIKLTWKKVSNATAYMVYRKTGSNGKWTRVKTTKSTSFTNTGLRSGQRYTYKVISYKQSGVKRSFSKYSNGRTVRAR